MSLRQQADVRLTAITVDWVEEQFQTKLSQFGKVSQRFIDSLDQGTPVEL